MAVEQRATSEPAAASREVSFGVTGMTCASCVRRIEKALSKVGGVQEAAVNLATERARVIYDPSVAGLEQLQGAVEKAGYGVRDLPAEAPSSPPPAAPAEASPGVPRDLVLPIEGMTCASC